MAQDNPSTSGLPAAPIPPAKHTPWKLIIGLVVGVFVLFLLAACGFVYFIFSMMRGSTVAEDAIKRASSNPAVVRELGTPIKMGWLVSGSINVSGGSGDADLAIPISGPKGKGTLYLAAHKSAGVWTFNALRVVVEGGGEPIDLLGHEDVVTWLAGPWPLTPLFLPERSYNLET